MNPSGTTCWPHVLYICVKSIVDIVHTSLFINGFQMEFRWEFLLTVNNTYTALEEQVGKTKKGKAYCWLLHGKSIF